MSKLTNTRSGARSGQLEFELSSLISLFQYRNVRTYLEVGARYGDTFYDVMMSLPKGSRGVCVDLPGDVWGNAKSQPHLESACDELREQGYDITLIIGNSTDQTIVDAVKALGPYDAALIDGDHRYKGVKTDYRNYGPMCSMVAFHDIVGYGQRHAASVNVEVPRFWAEVREGQRVQEFVEPGSKMGIGVICRT